MRRRLRKKKHLGEFHQYGFSLVCLLREGLSSEEFDSFVDTFIADAIEARGLIFGGGGSPAARWSGVVCRDHRYDSTTEEDCTFIREWLNRQAVVASFTISKPWDVWHGSDPLEAPSP